MCKHSNISTGKSFQTAAFENKKLSLMNSVWIVLLALKLQLQQYLLLAVPIDINYSASLCVGTRKIRNLFFKCWREKSKSSLQEATYLPSLNYLLYYYYCVSLNKFRNNDWFLFITSASTIFLYFPNADTAVL